MKVSAVILSVFCGLGCAEAPKNLDLGDAEFQVHVTRYRAGDKPSLKTLLIYPPSGGTNLIDRSYARKFRRHGYDVYILNSWTGEDVTGVDLNIHQRFYSGAQRALDLTLAEVESPFIGLLGTSVGALHASIAAATRPELKAVFVIVGGAPIADVIVASDQAAMVDLKKQRRQRYGLNSDQANITAINEAFSLEPMELGAGYKHKALGVVLARNDTTVPFRYQEKLRDFWRPQTVIEMSTDHFWGIVRTWLLHGDKILRFFEASVPK